MFKKAEDSAQKYQSIFNRAQNYKNFQGINTIYGFIAADYSIFLP